ncbi:MAG: Cytochrome c oxidase polypeptide 4 [Nitrosomonadaceae bacterium]|nr:Cytochrome c oxidase polypeptide 4 [Nitrosomonadaceae bacterium]
MKFAWKFFLGLTFFYAALTVIYAWLSHEVVGITALALSTGLSLIIGFYFWFTDRRLGAQPQDRLQAEIYEGAGELGFFSPGSWWPLPVAGSTIVIGLGLIIGWWLTMIGVGLLLITVVGFTMEYSRPGHGPH